jgi:predicted Zn finger-like uncharacterized protein
MPIAVVCPGCKAQFRVSDKFAGKQGPCPKCKAVINVPAAAANEVVIHAPDEGHATAGKDAKGRLISKPIPRSAFRPTRARMAAVAGAVVGIIAAALILRLLDGPVGGAAMTALRMAGLVAVSLPIVIAGYSFLRDVEDPDPYRGRTLWLRAGICALAYVLLWGAFALVPNDLLAGADYWIWFIVPAPFLVLGTLAALGTLDLDGTNAFFHYAFFLVVTLGLRFLCGMPPVWHTVEAAASR